MSAVALYRDYELPWTPSEDEQRRLRRVLGAVLGLFIAFGVIVPLLPERAPDPAQAVVPARVVEFLLERPKPKPKPPPAVEAPKPMEIPKVERPVVEPPPPRPTPKPQVRPDPKQKAASTGLLALSQQLAELRQIDVNTKPDTQPLNAGAGEKTRVDRALLTAKAGKGSAGIAVSAVSSGFGGGATVLTGHDTAKVAAPPSAAPPTERGRAERHQPQGLADARRDRAGLRPEQVRDLRALQRALRDKPTLQGKVVLEVTIAPNGEVTDCRVVTSELGDPELERKLVARVRMFRFESRDVAMMTTTKPIEFFPA